MLSDAYLLYSTYYVAPEEAPDCRLYTDYMQYYCARHFDGNVLIFGTAVMRNQHDFDAHHGTEWEDFSDAVIHAIDNAGMPIVSYITHLHGLNATSYPFSGYRAGYSVLMPNIENVATVREGIKILNMANNKNKKNNQAHKNGAKQAVKEVKHLEKHIKNLAPFTGGASRVGNRKRQPKFAGVNAKERKKMLGLKRANPYLHCLLDPGNFPCKYPDAFSENTGLFTSVIETDLKIDSSGEFHGSVFPGLRKCLQLRTNSADSISDPTAVGDYYYDLKKGDSRNRYSPGQRIKFDENDFSAFNGSCVPFKPVAAGSAGTFDYTYFDLSTTNVTITDVNIGGFESYIRLKNAAGNWAILFKDDATIPTSTTLVSATDALGVCAVCAPGAGATKFWLEYTSTVPTEVYIEECHIKTYFPQKANTWKSTFVDCTDIDQICEDLSGYRVVGQTVLVSWLGDLLNTSGRIVGWYFNGINRIVQADLLSRDVIATRAGSYSGPLSKGIWMHWKPCNARDMQFRDPDAELDSGIPMMVFAGNTGHPTDAKIRVRVTTCYEYLSTRAILSGSRSPVAPELITDAERKIATFPNAMENPVHEKRVRNFFTEVSDTLGHVWDSWSPRAKQGVEVGAEIALLMGLML